jgi:competence protein ComEC
LWSLGVKRIDVVAFTHTRADQLGGLDAIFENFRVDEFWHAPQAETPEYAALLERVAERAIPTRTLMAGDLLSSGDASIRVLAPEPEPASQNRAGGHDSLALRISAGGVAFLLANGSAEQAILTSLGRLASQVSTVGRARANEATANDFCARVAPCIVIVSAETGSERDAIAADPETMKIPPNSNHRIFRTDIDGATTVEAKPGLLVARTYRGSETVISLDGADSRPGTP